MWPQSSAAIGRSCECIRDRDGQRQTAWKCCAELAAARKRLLADHPSKADGTFTVETQPGKYAYFFSPKEGTKTLPAPAASYAQATMERTVQVASGQPLAIDLK